MTRQSTWRIYRWPLVINSICLIGLVSALIGDHGWDVLSWLCLGSAVVLMSYAASSSKHNK